MESNILYTHLTSAALFGYIMDHAQRWNKIPWLNRDTTRLNSIVRLVLASIATLGIHWTWSGDWSAGRQILISIPGLSVLGHAFFNLAGQYAMQHGWERVLDIGRTWRIDPKVFDDLVVAITQAINNKQNVPALPPKL